jgi:hypothetical protein
MTVYGLVLQVEKAQLILKNKMPQLDFVVEVVIAYILMGFLFAVAFYFFRNVLPGKTAARKGLTYGMFVALVVLIPGGLGLNAFDFKGLFDLFTPFKIENYLIAAVDTTNMFFGGFVLSRLFKKDIELTEHSRFPKSGVLLSGILGAVLLPLLMFSFHILLEKILSIGLDFPDGVRGWYFIGLLVPNTLAGGFLPLFYVCIADVFPDCGWVRRSWFFFLTVLICYEVINVAFILPFGYSLQTVIFLFLFIMLSLLIIIMLNGFLLRKHVMEAEKLCRIQETASKLGKS